MTRSFFVNCLIVAFLAVSASRAFAIPGDANGDDKVDMEDARFIARYVIGLIPALPNQDDADATQDNKVDMEDAFATAKYITGQSRIVIAGPMFGGSEVLSLGEVVRIDVFEHFYPLNVTGGTIRIQSTNVNYDSDIQPMIQAPDKRSFYFYWDTEGCLADSNYVAHFTFDTNAFSVTYELTPQNFPQEILSAVTDVSAPASGIPLRFQRISPHTPGQFPVKGPLGRSWTHNFNIGLDEFPDGHAVFRGGNGFNRLFTRRSLTRYTAALGDHGALTWSPVLETYTLKEKDGFIYHFHPDGRWDYMQDINSNRVTAVYNASTQLVEVTHSCGSSITFAYDSKGLMTNVTDAAGRSVTYRYDSFRLFLTNVIDWASNATYYSYTEKQHWLADNRLKRILNPDGTARHFTYDSVGRLTEKRGSSETGRVNYAYEPDGSMRKWDALNGQFRFRYNSRSLPIEIQNPLGAAVTNAFDSAFNLVRRASPLGWETRYSYDSWGNLTNMVDAAGNATSFGYDTNFHKMTWILDSRSNLTSFVYDSRGNCISNIWPGGAAETYVYSPQGLVTAKTTRAGQPITCGYDANGLLLSKKLPGASFAFEYDARGNMTSASNTAAGRISYTYDTLDRPVEATYPGGRTFKYAFNARGARTRVEDPDGNVVNYQYDSDGRLTRITDGDGKTIVEYLFDQAGRRVRRTLGNGAYATYAYDAAGQLTNLVNWTSSNNVISFFDYQYDAIGNAVVKNTMEGTERYSYDALNQLTNVVYTDGVTNEFIYDPMGNRTVARRNGGETVYGVNNLNQYTNVGSAAFTYDLNGNLASKTDGGNTTYYDYDCESRLTAVRMTGATNTYAYNALGLRSLRTDTNCTTLFLWDGRHVGIEEDSSHSTTSRYTWGSLVDEAVRMERGGKTCYFAQDAVLSVVDLLDDTTGAALEHYQYDAFGDPKQVSGLGNPYMFAGAPFDTGPRLYYLRARWYSPSLGRFISEDPSGIPGGLNLYAFCGNNSVVARDPFGFEGAIVKYLEGCAGEIVRWGNEIGEFFSGIVSRGKTDENEAFDEKEHGGGKGQSGNGPPSMSSRTAHDFRGRTVFTGSSVGGYSSYAFLGGFTCPTFIQAPPGKTWLAPAVAAKSGPVWGSILCPLNDYLLRSDIPIYGVAGGDNFAGYRVEFGEGRNPSRWTLINKSSLPQPAWEMGKLNPDLMQGDLDLRGNLGTWNTGLKNWEHLPWHPADDPIDFNGIYTIRLVVEGKQGEKAEDRIACEVGRAIAQCLPGTAVSPDKRVTMRFPEQSIMSPFRVYTILPFSATGEEQPAAPAGGKFVGEAYRIREPGDRFIKDVTLEFARQAGDTPPANAGCAGICAYDTVARSWNWLPTTRNENGTAYRTPLKELPAAGAVYALVADARAERSTVEPPETQVQPLKPLRPRILVENSFEQDMGTFKQRDRIIGAELTVVARPESGGGRCLQLRNPVMPGNFSCTVLEGSFDIRDYPLMEFDYRVGPDAKLDFLVRANGRWYCLGFTADPVDFYRRDVNIGNAGRISNVVADGKWHTATVHLQQVLGAKTGYTRVDEIVMANWTVGGYMKLDFGRNPVGATLWLDNFRISGSAITPAGSAPDILVVQRYDDPRGRNALGLNSGIFSSSDPQFCIAAIADGKAARGATLGLKYNVSSANSYAGYWTLLGSADTSEYGHLCLDLKSGNPALPPMLISLQNASGVEHKLPLNRYAGVPDSDGWMSVRIPMVAFGDMDRRMTKCLSLGFQHSRGQNKGEIHLDNLRFEKRLERFLLEDFESDQPRGDRTTLQVYEFQNRLSQRTYEFASGAASVRMDVDENRHPGDRGKSLMVSYGGSIGLDLHEAGFSFSGVHVALGGIDGSSYKNLRFRIRGNTGGEEPNIYLCDSAARKNAALGKYCTVGTDWKDVSIPLSVFARKGVDLTHLDGMEIIFEWKEMSGTVWLDELALE